MAISKVNLQEETDCEDCNKLKTAIDNVQRYCRANMVDPDEPAQGFDALLRIFCQAIIEITEQQTF